MRSLTAFMICIFICSTSSAVSCFDLTSRNNDSWEPGGRIEVSLRDIEADPFQEHGGEYVIYIQRGSDTVIAGVKFSRSAIKSVIQTAIKNQDFSSLIVSGVWVERTSYALMLEIDQIEDAPINQPLLLAPEGGQLEFDF